MRDLLVCSPLRVVQLLCPSSFLVHSLYVFSVSLGRRSASLDTRVAHVAREIAYCRKFRSTTYWRISCSANDDALQRSCGDSGSIGDGIFLLFW